MGTVARVPSVCVAPAVDEIVIALKMKSANEFEIFHTVFCSRSRRFLLSYFRSEIDMCARFIIFAVKFSDWKDSSWNSAFCCLLLFTFVN